MKSHPSYSSRSKNPCAPKRSKPLPRRRNPSPGRANFALALPPSRLPLAPMRRLLALLLSVSPLAAAEPDLKPLEAWIAGQKGLKSLDAEFVQERKLPSLKKPVATPGRLRVQRPGKLLWELGQPV